MMQRKRVEEREQEMMFTADSVYGLARSHDHNTYKKVTHVKHTH